MAKDDQEEAFEKLISATLSRFVDFVKFAEAKNAALLTFCSAWILASVNFLGSPEKLPANYALAFSFALPIFGIAALICIISFLPRMLDRFYKPEDGSKSLLFFGDAASFSIPAYRKRLIERYKPPDGHSTTTAFIDDLSVQIAVNAKIAKRKFTLFSIAAVLTLIAIVLLMLPPIWWGITAVSKMAHTS